MSYLLTGASGFIGQSLAKHLNSVAEVKAIVRKTDSYLPVNIQQHEVNLTLLDDLNLNVFEGVDTLIHCAARAHIMNDDSLDPLQEYRKINRDATLKLAKLAADNGVKRFVFLSSIKVNGEFTNPNKAFTPEITHAPEDPYGLSKYEAEIGLLKIAEETIMEIVIIRLPLVYGPGVKGNFATMVNWVKKGIPMPFGAVHNLRSMIALENLVDFISLCADRKRSSKAGNEVFLVSDGEDISTTQLLKNIANAYQQKSRVFPVPVKWMLLLATSLGKQNMARRLFGNLQVDISKSKNLLNWEPKVTMQYQLKKMANWDAKQK